VAHRHAPRHERKAERQCIGLMSRSTVILHTGLGADVSRERSPRDISMPRSSTIVDDSAPSCRSHDSSRCLVLLCCVASTEKVVADERLTSPFGYHHRHTMRIRQRTITSWRPTTNRQHHESATEQAARASFSSITLSSGQRALPLRESRLCWMQVWAIFAEKPLINPSTWEILGFRTGFYPP
jgi:hypothetical protein